MDIKELGATQATINKIQTTVDYGVRLTLDLDANDSELIKKLFDLKMRGEELLYVGFSCDANSLK